MGKSYFVPRSAKGESRILYIFTIKSFAFTVSIGLIGALIWYIMSSIFEGFPLVAGLVITGIFGTVGYCIGALKIPDSKFMGPFRKAGGEYLSDIILRAITFKKRKKIYLYNLNRGGK